MPRHRPTAFAILLLGVLAMVRGAGAQSVDERVWIEAGYGVAAATVADLSSAIRLRLPGWSVEPRPEGLAAAEDGAWVVRLRAAEAALLLDVVDPDGQGCRSRPTAWSRRGTGPWSSRWQ
jgi:hypothetical protein